MSIVARTLVYDAVGAFINTTIGASVGNRVYFMIAPQNEAGITDLPLVIYSVTGDVPTYDMGTEHLDIDFQVNFFGKKDLGVEVLRAISDTLVSALDGVNINIDGYDNEIVFVTNAGVPTIEDDNIINIRIGFNLRGS